MEWNKVYWSGEEQNNVDRSGEEWKKVEWNRGDRGGVEWSGVEQSRSEWRQVVSRPLLAVWLGEYWFRLSLYVYDRNRPLAPILRQRRCSLMYDVY